jgi:phosphoketolase
MSLQFNDWSTHLMQAEIQLKAMEHKLLHKDYADIKRHAEAVNANIDKTMAWLALQGADGGGDVLEVLQFSMDNNTYSKFHPILLAAKTEIERLRVERQFWLKSGYHIGKQNAVKE